MFKSSLSRTDDLLDLFWPLYYSFIIFFRVIVPFLACGDLSAYDSDRTYGLDIRKTIIIYKKIKINVDGSFKGIYIPPFIYKIMA